MPNKSAGGARLASSVWLVCKKRPETARPGWDNRVLEEMRESPHACAISGMQAFAGRISSGRQQGQRWKPTASTL
jgi:hypothetical protein